MDHPFLDSVDRELRLIALIVLSIHLLLVLLLVIQPLAQARPIPRKVQVRTITPAPVIQTPAQLAPKQKAQTAAPEKKSPPKPVKKEQPAPAKKRDLSKLNQALATLSFLEEEDSPSQERQLERPKYSSKPASVSKVGDFSPFEQEIIERLRRQLRLPEYGSVEIRVTLARSGKVLDLEILGAASVVNQKWVEEKIPSVVFPSFGARFEGKERQTFQLLLTNE